MTHAHDKTEERDALIRLLFRNGNEPERIAGQMGLAVEVVREVVAETQHLVSSCHGVHAPHTIA